MGYFQLDIYKVVKIKVLDPGKTIETKQSARKAK